MYYNSMLIRNTAFLSPITTQITDKGLIRDHMGRHVLAEFTAIQCHILADVASVDNLIIFSLFTSTLGELKQDV